MPAGRSHGSAPGVPAEWSGRAVRARAATGGTWTLSGLVLRTRGCLLFAVCLMIRDRMPDTFCRTAETKAERPHARKWAQPAAGSRRGAESVCWALVLGLGFSSVAASVAFRLLPEALRPCSCPASSFLPALGRGGAGWGGWGGACLSSLSPPPPRPPGGGRCSPGPDSVAGRSCVLGPRGQPFQPSCPPPASAAASASCLGGVWGLGACPWG